MKLFDRPRFSACCLLISGDFAASNVYQPAFSDLALRVRFMQRISCLAEDDYPVPGGLTPLIVDRQGKTADGLLAFAAVPGISTESALHLQLGDFPSLRYRRGAPMSRCRPLKRWRWHGGVLTSSGGSIACCRRFWGAEMGMKCHLAVGSDLQPRPVVLVALLEDNSFAAYAVARYSVQLDSCIRRCDPGETGVPVDLEHGIADVERLTVTMRYVAHRARLGTECLTDYGGVKFAEIGRLFRHILCRGL